MLLDVWKHDQDAHRIFEDAIKDMDFEAFLGVAQELKNTIEHHPQAIRFLSSLLCDQPDIIPVIIDRIQSFSGNKEHFPDWYRKAISLPNTRNAIWEKAVNYYVSMNPSAPRSLHRIQQVAQSATNLAPYHALKRGIQLMILMEYIESQIPQSDQG